MLMTTTCEWRGHAVANLSEMSSLEWFTTLDRDESQPRSALTPPGAPIYFRLRTLSHSTDTVHLANQIIVGCQAAGFCRSSTQAATGATGFPSPLQEGVWSRESPAVRCFRCRSGSRCAALLVPPLPVRSAVRRSPGRCGPAVAGCGLRRRSPWTGCRWPPRAPELAVPVSAAACWNQRRRRLLSARRRVGSAGPPLPWWCGRCALELAAWCCGTAAAELVAGFVLHRRVDSLPLPVEPLPSVVCRNRWPAAPRALSHRAAASGVRFGANDRASWLVLCAGASGRRGPCTGRGGRGAGCRRVPRAGNPFALVLRSARPRRRSPARLPGRPETSPTAFQTARPVSQPRPTASGKNPTLLSP